MQNISTVLANSSNFTCVFQDMDTATWESMLDNPPEQLTAAEREAWLKQMTDVALSSDAFFPFRDNIDRARQVGVLGLISLLGLQCRNFIRCFYIVCDDSVVKVSSSGT